MPTIERGRRARRFQITSAQTRALAPARSAAHQCSQATIRVLRIEHRRSGSAHTGTYVLLRTCPRREAGAAPGGQRVEEPPEAFPAAPSGRGQARARKPVWRIGVKKCAKGEGSPPASDNSHTTLHVPDLRRSFSACDPAGTASGFIRFIGGGRPFDGAFHHRGTLPVHTVCEAGGTAALTGGWPARVATQRSAAIIQQHHARRTGKSRGQKVIAKKRWNFARAGEVETAPPASSAPARRQVEHAASSQKTAASPAGGSKRARTRRAECLRLDPQAAPPESSSTLRGPACCHCLAVYCGGGSRLQRPAGRSGIQGEQAAGSGGVTRQNMKKPMLQPRPRRDFVFRAVIMQRQRRSTQAKTASIAHPGGVELGQPGNSDGAARPAAPSRRGGWSKRGTVWSAIGSSPQRRVPAPRRRE